MIAAGQRGFMLFGKQANIDPGSNDPEDSKIATDIIFAVWSAINGMSNPPI